MSALGEIFGGSHPFRHRGKTYHVSLVTYGVMRDFSRALFARDAEAHSDMRPAMTPEEYEAGLAAMRKEYRAGGYALHSPKGTEALGTLDGMLTLAGLLFGVGETEMFQILAEHPTEVPALLRVLMDESFPEASRAKPSDRQGRGPAAEVPVRHAHGQVQVDP